VVDILTYDDLFTRAFQLRCGPRARFIRGASRLERPNMASYRKKVPRDALSLLTQTTRPGEFVTMNILNYGEQYEPPRVKKLG